MFPRRHLSVVIGGKIYKAFGRRVKGLGTIGMVRERYAFQIFRQESSMDESRSLGSFAKEWANYLEQHGHSVRQLSRAPKIVTSRNGQGKLYRWLLWQAERDPFLLSPSDHREIRRQARLGKGADAGTYIVARFEEPTCKVIVMPAAMALKAKRLSPDKGGIPWRY